MTQKTVAVAVQDARPYIVSGEKEPDFVGLSRGGFGNPFDVTTTTNRALADDMTYSIVSTMKAQKIKASAVIIPPDTKTTAVRSMLLKSDADRKVWMVLEEWKADTYSSTKLLYDVTVRILDKTGRERGIKRINGDDTLGGDFFNPPSFSRQALPTAFKSKIEQLFNDPVIADALK